MSKTFSGWATVDLDQSTGSKTTVWTGTENKGRSPRGVKIAYQTRNQSTTIVRLANINQTGHAPYVSLKQAAGSPISQASVSRTNVAGTLVVSGVSNCQGLKFQIIQIEHQSDSRWVSLPSTFTGDGNTITLVDGAGDIPNDPGNTGEYNFSITLSLEENTTISQRQVTFRVSDSDDNTVYDEITITQSAGSAYLRINSTNVDPTEQGQTVVTITLDATGTAQNIYTFSNCEWEIVNASE